MSQRRCTGCGGGLAGSKGHGYVTPSGGGVLCNRCEFPESFKKLMQKYRPRRREEP